MRSPKLDNRLVPWFAACGVVLSLGACTSEDPQTQNGAGTGGSTAAAGGTGGAGGTVAGTTSAGGAGGTAGTGTGGTGGTAMGGTAGTVAGSGGTAGAGGSAGSSEAGVGGASGGSSAAGAGGVSGSTGSGGAGGAAGSGAGMRGSSGSGAGSAGTNGGGSGGSGGAAVFALTSPVHSEGAEFADKYTCAAAGFEGSLLPELRWTAGPSGTMSYAITFIDITLTEDQPPSDLGYHWVIWNIPPSTLTLPEAFKNQTSIMANENRDYLGPCPYFGGSPGDPHTYEFTIYALSQSSITISPTTGTGAVKDAEAKLEATSLAKAKLTGTSTASPP